MTLGAIVGRNSAPAWLNGAYVFVHPQDGRGTDVWTAVSILNLFLFVADYCADGKYTLTFLCGPWKVGRCKVSQKMVLVS